MLCTALSQGCWRDGILAGTPGQPLDQPHQLTQSEIMAASNYVPLWVGLTEGDAQLGARVVDSLRTSGLVQPSGGCCDVRGWCSEVGLGFRV